MIGREPTYRMRGVGALAACILLFAGAAVPARGAPAPACDTYDRTLSVRANGGRVFLLMCGGVSPDATPTVTCGKLYQGVHDRLWFYESGSCSGAVTFSWSVNGTAFSELMNVTSNGNEPPECDPITPANPLVLTADHHARGGIFCLDYDFSGSSPNWQEDITALSASNTHGGSVTLIPDDETYGLFEIDYVQAKRYWAAQDSFAITVADDFEPNPKQIEVDVVVSYPTTSPPRVTTEITAGPSGRVLDRTPKFKFIGTPEGVDFRCKLNDGRFRSCSSPKTYDRLPFGRHVFKVKAVDIYGYPDVTPASRSFRIVRPD